MVEIIGEEDVPAVSDSKQVTVEEEADTMISENSTTKQEIGSSTAGKVNESELYNKDDVEELLEPSPTKEEPLRDEFISE